MAHGAVFIDADRRCYAIAGVFGSAALEEQIDDRHDEQIEYGRNEHPAKDGGAQRVTRFGTRTAGEDERENTQHEGQRRHQNRAQPGLRRLDHGRSRRQTLRLQLIGIDRGCFTWLA
jgi:hypothetical protein